MIWTQLPTINPITLYFYNFVVVSLRTFAFLSKKYINIGKTVILKNTIIYYTAQGNIVKQGMF